MVDLRITYLLFIGLLSLSCTNSDKPVNDAGQAPPEEVENTGTLYANEYGQIELVQINDTVMRTIFKNNDGDVFDTTMKIMYDFKIIHSPDSLPFYSIGMRGIQQYNDYLRVFEFSSMLYLDQHIRIEKMYERPFYKMGSAIRIEGDVMKSKGTTVDGIWIEQGDDLGYDFDYAIVHGVLHKEKYPEAFYSTDESPQGMFSKEDGIQYRLVFEDANFEAPQKTEYQGYPVMTASGDMALAWEFADSEAFILEGYELKNRHQLSEKITVSGYLVQDQRGSFLKNWEIVNGH